MGQTKLSKLEGVWKGKADFSFEEIKDAEIKILEEHEMSEETKRLAERVHDAILAHRHDVSGKDSSDPHLDHNSVETSKDGGYVVRFWSTQGLFHDCEITATLSKDGILTFDHCGDEGMKKLVRLVRDEI